MVRHIVVVHTRHQTKGDEHPASRLQIIDLDAGAQPFLRGKLEGLNDKDAARAAGYSLSVSENTKQRIWKPNVRQAFQRLARTD
jgi:hypothetical protein